LLFGRKIYAVSADEVDLLLSSKRPLDPVICSILEDNFEALAQIRNQEVYNTAASLCIPTFIEAMVSAGSDQPWITTSALEFSTKFVASKLASEDLVIAAERSLFRCVESTQDRDIQQVFLPHYFVESILMMICYKAGIQCLNELIKEHASVSINWTDETGRNGLDHTLMLIATLLNPTGDESGGLVIGDLIINLLRKAGEAILPALPTLLQVMIGKMMTAKTPTLIQVGFFISLLSSHRSGSELDHPICAFTTNAS
jgi:importin-9